MEVKQLRIKQFYSIIFMNHMGGIGPPLQKFILNSAVHTAIVDKDVEMFCCRNAMFARTKFSLCELIVTIPVVHRYPVYTCSLYCFI